MNLGGVSYTLCRKQLGQPESRDLQEAWKEGGYDTLAAEENHGKTDNRAFISRQTHKATNQRPPDGLRSPDLRSSSR